MYQKPDYQTARAKAGFHWHVSGSQDALRELTGTPIREFNLNPQVCIETYRKGLPILQEMFGEDVALPGLATPHISYGHVNGLGSELIFPEGGEVAQTHIYKSLDEGIRELKKPVNYAAAGMAPFFLDFREKIKAAFPNQPVGFSWGLEGPITTAFELRGHAIFTDILDDPEKAREFLRLVTDSILDFQRFRCALDQVPAMNPKGAGMCDDIASMVAPHLWPTLVLPFWEQYFNGLTTGIISAHVEDLRSSQLQHLDTIGLSNYDPSISHKLNPEIIARECRVPFAWRLGSFHFANLDCQDVRDFVVKAAADGATSVFTCVASDMCNPESVKKVHSFIAAAKEVKTRLDQGVSREQLQREVSPRGQKKFWAHWLN
ncbi:MAG: uroporphyrinogen decarboxylase family protein [Verrucomicrobiae bacterium]|nr:uroporphyrinogen decarboxylase family protein [Verrucomicrobiae bacterium]